MSQQVNARNIGLFTIGGLLLLVAGILVFGSGDWFKEQDRIEMVFTGSVKGLNVGSSITYRGVRIGEVEKINITQYGDDINIRVQGLIIQQESDSSFYSYGADRNEMFNQLVTDGVRAQLVQESLVTGRLQIQLEFFENDIQSYAPESQSGYLLLPTVPSEIEMLGDTIKEFVHKFDDMPIKEITDNLAAITKGLDGAINSEETQIMMVNLSQSLVHLNSFLGELDKDKEVMTDEVVKASKALRTMADSFTDVAEKSEPMIAGATRSLKNLDQLLDQSSRTLKAYEQLIQPGSELSVSLIQTLQSFDRASEQVRQLAETLQRNPESILTGKQR